MEQLTRRELLVRGRRLALVGGAVPLGGWLAELARSSSGGNFAELARELSGSVVVRGATDYDRARVLRSRQSIPVTR